VCTWVNTIILLIYKKCFIILGEKLQVIFKRVILNFMKLRQILILIVVLSSKLSFAQNTINGKVIDKDSLQLPFSIILLKEQDSIIDYSQSDFDGKFVIFQDIKKGMYLETHFIDEMNIIALDSLKGDLLIKINYQEKISKEQLEKWQKEMFKKYKLEFKEE
jgi:hypothetical protein